MSTNRRAFLSFTAAISLLTLAGAGIIALLRPQTLHHVQSLAEKALRSKNTAADVFDLTSPGVVIVTAKRAVYTDVSLSETDIIENGAPRLVPDLAPPREPQKGTGTGFIIDDSGLIITNHHVVREADRVLVKLNDGREFKAVIQGTDPETDLALLKIDADKLTALPLGDSDKLRPGDPVIAIGNPLEYEYSVTAGIISARGRKVYNNPPFEQYIQTDAAINRGNSGGPLLNLSGEVIGVNTIIRADGRGISFAVPSNIVRKIAQHLRSQGFVARGFLGLQPQNLTSAFREALGLKKDASGVVVVDVTPDKPAARAGIQTYDVITRFDGKELHNQDDFFSTVAGTLPQREVEIEILRNAQLLRLRATLERRQDEVSSPPESSITTQFPSSQKLGFTVQERNANQTLNVSEEKPDTSNAVIVAEVDPLSSASDAGLQAAMQILEINRQPVQTLEDFQRLIAPLKSGSAVVLRVSTQPTRVVSLIAFRVE
jgi:serine protease Do